MDPTILHGISRIRVLLPLSIPFQSAVSVSINRRGWMAARVPPPFEKILPSVGCDSLSPACVWFLFHGAFSLVWTVGYLGIWCPLDVAMNPLPLAFLFLVGIGCPKDDPAYAGGTSTCPDGTCFHPHLLLGGCGRDQDRWGDKTGSKGRETSPAEPKKNKKKEEKKRGGRISNVGHGGRIVTRAPRTSARGNWKPSPRRPGSQEKTKEQALEREGSKIRDRGVKKPIGSTTQLNPCPRTTVEKKKERERDEGTCAQHTKAIRAACWQADGSMKKPTLGRKEGKLRIFYSLLCLSYLEVREREPEKERKRTNPMEVERMD